MLKEIASYQVGQELALVSTKLNQSLSFANCDMDSLVVRCAIVKISKRPKVVTVHVNGELAEYPYKDREIQTDQGHFFDEYSPELIARVQKVKAQKERELLVASINAKLAAKVASPETTAEDLRRILQALEG